MKLVEYLIKLKPPHPNGISVILSEFPLRESLQEMVGYSEDQLLHSIELFDYRTAEWHIVRV